MVLRHPGRFVVGEVIGPQPPLNPGNRLTVHGLHHLGFGRKPLGGIEEPNKAHTLFTRGVFRSPEFIGNALSRPEGDGSCRELRNPRRHLHRNLRIAVHVYLERTVGSCRGTSGHTNNLSRRFHDDARHGIAAQGGDPYVVQIPAAVGLALRTDVQAAAARGARNVQRYVVPILKRIFGPLAAHGDPFEIHRIVRSLVTIDFQHSLVIAHG